MSIVNYIYSCIPCLCLFLLFLLDVFFFFKHKTAYEMRISDWSSDVCSSDLHSCARVWHPRFEAARKFIPEGPIPTLPSRLPLPNSRTPRKSWKVAAETRSGKRGDMARIVMKFGGTSMAGTERIRTVARLVAREAANGNEVAVVVSAMAGETDRLRSEEHTSELQSL